MASQPERPTGGADVDGVRIVRRGGWPRDVAVVGAVAVGLGLAFVAWRGDPVAAPSAPVASKGGPVVERAARTGSGGDGETAPPGQILPRSRGAKLRALRAMGVTPTKGPEGKRELDAAPVIEALQRAGVREGIAAFPPPGTDPPKSGIVVPDDWELPEGYLRHHQTTDDGEQLPPILMFHPDYEFVDEHGNKIVVPPDRVVPPELAPPGLTIRMLDVPKRQP